MSSNSLLHFITQLVNFEGFKVTNYHFIKEVIPEYLLVLGCELLNQIEKVSIDLWIPYKSSNKR